MRKPINVAIVDQQVEVASLEAGIGLCLKELRSGFAHDFTTSPLQESVDRILYTRTLLITLRNASSVLRRECLKLETLRKTRGEGGQFA